MQIFKLNVCLSLIIQQLILSTLCAFNKLRQVSVVIIFIYKQECPVKTPILHIVHLFSHTNAYDFPDLNLNGLLYVSANKINLIMDITAMFDPISQLVTDKAL